MVEKSSELLHSWSLAPVSWQDGSTIFWEKQAIKLLLLRMSENGDSVSFEEKERDVKIITAYDSDYFMAAI